MRTNFVEGLSDSSNPGHLVGQVALRCVATPENVYVGDEVALFEGAIDTRELGLSPYGEDFDWAEAEGAGIHVQGSGNRITPSNEGRHSSFLGGMLRAGHDLPSIDGFDDFPL